MKTPDKRIVEAIRQSYVDNIGWIRRFIAMWGTTIVRGVTVLRLRQYVFQRGENPTVRVSELKSRPVDLVVWTEYDHKGRPIEVCEVSDPVYVYGDEYTDGYEYQPTGTATRENAGISKNDFMKRRVRDLVRFLGAYNNVTKDYPKGVEWLALYLNPNKEITIDSSSGEITETLGALDVVIANRLAYLTEYVDYSPNIYPKDRYTFRVYINPTGTLRVADSSTNTEVRSVLKSLDVGVSDLNSPGFLSFIRSKQEFIESNLLLSESDRDFSDEDGFLDAFVRYAIFDPSLGIVIKNVKAVPVKVTDTYYQDYDDDSGGGTSYYEASPVIITGIAIDYEVGALKPIINSVTGEYFIPSAFTSADKVVRDIAESGERGRRIKYDSIRGFLRVLVDGNIARISINDLTTYTQLTAVFTGANNQAPTIPELWVRAPGTNDWYLKKETIYNKTYIRKIEDRIYFVSSLLDSTYKKKKRSTFGKLVGGLLVVIGVVLIFTGNPGQGIAFLKAAAITLTIASIVFAVLGLQDLAMMLSDAARIVSVASIFASLTVFINQGFGQIAAQKAAEQLGQAATQEAINAAATEIARQMTVQLIVQLVTLTLELVGIEIPGIPLSYQEAAYMVTQMYISMEVEDLSKKINENQKKMAELQQDREMALMRDRELEKVKLITNPMTMEVTSVELDGPYEPISGPYHTGNICKTTVFPMYFGK